MWSVTDRRLNQSRQPSRSRGWFWAISSISLGLLLEMGCSPPPSRPPAGLTKQIALADRIIVTNRYLAFSMTVTGKDFEDVSSAVTNAIEDKHHYDAIFDMDIQFYAGSNFLTVIHLQDRAFLAGSNQYSDSSGVLKQFWQSLEQRAEGK